MTELTPKSFGDEITKYATEALKNIDNNPTLLTGQIILAVIYKESMDACKGNKNINSFRNIFLMSPTELADMTTPKEKPTLKQINAIIDNQLSEGKLSKKQANYLRKRAITLGPQQALDEIRAKDQIPNMVDWMLKDKIISQQDADMYRKNLTVETFNALKQIVAEKGAVRGMLSWLLKFLAPREIKKYQKMEPSRARTELQTLVQAYYKWQNLKKNGLIKDKFENYMMKTPLESPFHVLDRLNELERTLKRKSEKDDAISADKLLDEL